MLTFYATIPGVGVVVVRAQNLNEAYDRAEAILFENDEIEVDFELELWPARETGLLVTTS